MSLYNSIFGVNALAPLLLSCLGLTDERVPRFRDCYTDGDRIVIYTRTGGGNRDFYESEQSCRKNYPEYFQDDSSPQGPWNEDLRALPYYLRDEDDAFDATYAYFYFDFPPDFVHVRDWARAHAAVSTETPTERFQQLLNDLREHATDNPDVARALKVGEEIAREVLETLENSSPDNQL